MTDSVSQTTPRAIYSRPGIWLIWLAVVITSLAMGLYFEAHPSISDYPPNVEFEYRQLVPDSPLAYLNKWEGFNVWVLVERGYLYDTALAVKFPLYPFLVRVLHEFSLRAIRIPLALFIIHKLALLVTIAEVYRFTENMGQSGKRGVMWLLATFTLCPLVWIYHYDTALSAALFWGCLTLWQRRHFGWMMLCGVLLVLARPLGIVFAASVALYALWDFDRHREKATWMHFLWWLPLFIWVLWVWHISDLTGRFFAPFTAQADWGRTQTVFPLVRLWDMIDFWLTHAHDGDTGAVLITWQLTMTVIVSLPLLAAAAWRHKTGGLFVSVIYTWVAVLLPLATATNVARLSMDSLVPLMPLLLPDSWQRRLQRFEPALWILFWILGIFLTLMAGVRYNIDWGIGFVP